MGKRRPTFWERVSRWPADWCRMCANAERRQRKMQAWARASRWYACPVCDLPEPAEPARAVS